LKSLSLKITVLLVALFVIEACVPSKPAYEDSNIPSERLIKKLEGNRRKIKTFMAKGVMNVKSPEMEAKANIEVMLQKPDSIKFSVYGPFGIDLAQAVVTGKSFVFHDVLRNKVYKGKNGEDIINRIFKVNLSFDDLMDAFAGSVNLTEKLRKIPTAYEAFEDYYLLSYIDKEADKQSIYKVSNDNLAITEYVLKSLNNEPYFESEYKRFKLFDEVAIPYFTIVKNDEKSQEVTIEYREIEINKAVGPFEINYPDDAEIIEWDE